MTAWKDKHSEGKVLQRLVTCNYSFPRYLFKMIDEFTKGILKKTLMTIIFIAVIVTIGKYMSQHNFWTYPFIIFFVTIFKDCWSIIVENAKKYLKTILAVTVLFAVMRFSLTFGIVGFIVLVILLAAYKMFISKSAMLDGMRNIETKIFGKSLDKENWKDDKK